jgi:hypothetical protein
MNLKKAAVVFPGIGYHTDKPLLYYGKKLAAARGYEIIDVPYGNFQHGIKGNAKKMRDAFESALRQSEEILADRRLEEYDELLFLSKSVGTVAASAYASNHHLTVRAGKHVRHIYFTPVDLTFLKAESRSGIVFHGTGDPWASNEAVQEGCSRLSLPLFLIPDANHSLETGDVMRDLDNLKLVMEHCAAYLDRPFQGGSLPLKEEK